MQILPYNREKAIAYAHKWAFGRNPAYYNFHSIGGDCTNFVSQSILNGDAVMNRTQTFGWYYINANRHSPSWTGVDYLYNFLTNNTGIGPFAVEVDIRDIRPGDVAQLKFSGREFQHSPFIVQTGSPVDIDNILVAAHTDDSDYRPLNTYNWSDIRFIHILGIRR